MKRPMLAASATYASKRTLNFPSPIPIESSRDVLYLRECHVKDEGNKWAIFSEITSCPATMEAGKAADALRLLPGHEILLPLGFGYPRTDGCLNGMASTMIPSSVLSLPCMGIPDAGGFWEQH